MTHLTKEWMDIYLKGRLWQVIDTAATDLKLLLYSDAGMEPTQMEPSVLLLEVLDCNTPALAGRSDHGNDCHECLLWAGRLDDMKENLGGRGQLVLIPLQNL